MNESIASRLASDHNQHTTTTTVTGAQKQASTDININMAQLFTSLAMSAHDPAGAKQARDSLLNLRDYKGDLYADRDNLEANALLIMGVSTLDTARVHTAYAQYKDGLVKFSEDWSSDSDMAGVRAGDALSETLNGLNELIELKEPYEDPLTLGAYVTGVSQYIYLGRIIIQIMTDGGYSKDNPPLTLHDFGNTVRNAVGKLEPSNMQANAETHINNKLGKVMDIDKHNHHWGFRYRVNGTTPFLRNENELPMVNVRSDQFTILSRLYERAIAQPYLRAAWEEMGNV
jgi:hypothetical protein